MSSWPKHRMKKIREFTSLIFTFVCVCMFVCTHMYTAVFHSSQKNDIRCPPPSLSACFSETESLLEPSTQVSHSLKASKSQLPSSVLGLQMFVWQAHRAIWVLGFKLQPSWWWDKHSQPCGPSPVLRITTSFSLIKAQKQKLKQVTGNRRKQ